MKSKSKNPSARKTVCGQSSWRLASSEVEAFVKKQLREPSAAARDDDAARRLWQLSEELTGLTPARPAGS